MKYKLKNIIKWFVHISDIKFWLSKVIVFHRDKFLNEKQIKLNIETGKYIIL